MPGHDIMVIGTSSGGVEALKRLVTSLPADLAASLFIVLHRPADSPSLLAEILQSVCPLGIADAEDGEAIGPGRIYIAPPDYHLLINPGRIRLTRGPKENRFRPAIDPLFRSAAAYYGPRVVGVVLTGNLGDGTAGLWAIKDRGGITIVQNPQEALYPSMPSSALANVDIDYCLGIGEIGAMLTTLSTQPATGGRTVSEKLEIETRIAMEDNALEAGVLKLGKPSLFTCPECHGTMLQVEEGDSIRFRCHTGHAYSIGALIDEVTESIEHSLWSSVRTMEELVLLLRDLGGQVREHEDTAMAARITKQTNEIQQRIQLIRQALLQQEPPSPDAAAAS